MNWQMLRLLFIHSIMMGRYSKQMDFILAYPHTPAKYKVQERNTKENTHPQTHQEPIWSETGRQSMEQLFAQGLI